VLVSAPRGEGRTNFALNMALNQAKDGRRVVYVSPNEGYTITRRKVAAALSGIPRKELAKPSAEIKRHAQLTTKRIENTFKIFCPTNGSFDEALEAMLALPDGLDVLFLDDLDVPYWSGNIRTRNIVKVKEAAEKKGIVIVVVVRDKRIASSGKIQRMPKTLKQNVEYWLRISRYSDPYYSVTVMTDLENERGIPLRGYMDSSRYRVALSVGSDELAVQG